MTPALSITYDSSGSNVRNGLLGMGFYLEGLTAITRCPSNYAQGKVSTLGNWQYYQSLFRLLQVLSIAEMPFFNQINYKNK